MIYVVAPWSGNGDMGRPVVASYDIKTIEEYIATKKYPGEWDWDEVEVI